MPSDEAILAAIRTARDEVDDIETRALFDFYARLLARLAARKRDLDPAPLQLPTDRATAAARLREGLPLLVIDERALAAQGFGAWAREVRDLLGERDPGLLLEAETLSDADAIALARTFFDEGTTGEGPALDAIIANALAPWLERGAEMAAPLLTAAPWEQAFCPTCGARPDFAALVRGDQARDLLCERCRTEWRVPADFCVFCGEDEPDRLGFFATEDDSYRVEVCDSCSSYLKVIRRSATPHALLAAERLLTPGLDMLAAAQGYTRPIGWEAEEPEMRRYGK